MSDGGGKGSNWTRRGDRHPSRETALLRLPATGRAVPGEVWWALSLAMGRCHYGDMAKTVIVKLIDDIDGGDADETVRFSLDEKSFEIDLNSANAIRLRSALKPFTDKARATASSRGTRGPSATRPSASGPTLYSQLSDDEKARFRGWADMGTARRISDARVKNWVAAGRP
jgi:hypothetical protein